jgi:hypothetical protein
MRAPADFLSASPEDGIDAAASRSDFAFTKPLRLMRRGGQATRLMRSCRRRTLIASWTPGSSRPRHWRWDPHKARMIRRSQSSSPISRRCGASATRCSNQRVGGSPRPFAWSSKPRVARAFGTERDNGTGRRRPRDASQTGAIRAIYSAATRCASSAGSILAAQYLNSGIFPNGSSLGLVSRFAAAST